MMGGSRFCFRKISVFLHKFIKLFPNVCTCFFLPSYAILRMKKQMHCTTTCLASVFAFLHSKLNETMEECL